MPPDSGSRSLTPLLIVILACAVACLAIDSQSFWVDEVQTVQKAMPPTLHGWWDALYSEHNSNMQLPLYMIYIWTWARFFGVSELALRAANIPWFFLGLVAIFHFLRRRPGLRNATLLLYCLHPFVWYYLNEARPYLMQLSGALLVAGALFAALDAEEEPLSSSWWCLFCTGMTILCGAGLLGVPWAIAVTVLLIFRPGFLRSIFHSGLPAVLLFSPMIILLTLYYAWTLKENITAGHRPMTIASMASVFYDQLGFFGLGPGRASLRPATSLYDSFSMLCPFLPLLCLFGLPLAWGLILAARRRFGLTPARFTSILLLAAVPVVLIFTLGYIRETRLLSRHLTPLFCVMLLAEAYAFLLLWRSKRPLGRAGAALFLAALTVSSLETRFAYRHQKDDNRDAAAMAKAALARGGQVWWVADAGSAIYYGLPLSDTARPGTALLLWVPTFDQVAGQKPPALIFLCKPELFDLRNGARDFIKQQGYAQIGTLPSFSIWSK